MAVLGTEIRSARGEPPRFVTVAPGIALGGASSRRPVAQIVAPYPAVVAINASFFDKDGRTNGARRRRGAIDWQWQAAELGRARGRGKEGADLAGR